MFQTTLFFCSKNSANPILMRIGPQTCGASFPKKRGDTGPPRPRPYHASFFITGCAARIIRAKASAALVLSRMQTSPFQCCLVNLIRRTDENPVGRACWPTEKVFSPAGVGAAAMGKCPHAPPGKMFRGGERHKSATQEKNNANSTALERFPYRGGNYPG